MHTTPPGTGSLDKAGIKLSLQPHCQQERLSRGLFLKIASLGTGLAPQLPFKPQDQQLGPHKPGKVAKK